MSVGDLRPGLRAFLAADATIAALVVAGGITRIYPNKLPQGVVATSLVYQEISNVGDHHNAGPSGLASPRMQITAWAGSADAAATLARAVKSRIDGYRGTMGSGGDAVTVQGVFFQDSRDIEDDETPTLFGKQADYRIVWNER